ncbi:MAG: hypothetical protein WAZ12_00065, partial [Candidatus Absconditicoccaceae bacterium]
MGYITTPEFGMQLADPATIQAFETSVVNDNFLALENGIVVEQTRITGVVAEVDVLQAGVGRGTLTSYTVASHAALDAITTAVPGDLAYITAPGTGINALRCVAYSGSGATIEWRVDDEVVADTLANLDAFIAAVVALSGTDVLFVIGKLAFTAGTQVFYRFTSTAGAKIPLGGLIPIVPTSVAGTGVTLGTNGEVASSGL